MSKDKLGNEIHVGDPVVLLGRVKAIDQACFDEGRNVEVEIEGPDCEHRPTLHVNAKLLALDH